MTSQCRVSRDAVFHLNHSYFMEDMTATFYYRTDKICIFMQLLLGSAVMGNIISTTLTGFIIAVIAAYQFSCNPAKMADKAKQQALRYGGIIHDINRYDDAGISDAVKTLEPDDSPVLLSVRKAGYIQAAVASGKTEAADIKFSRLNFFDRIVIFMAGGIQH